jgi:hypothetical protein
MSVLPYNFFSTLLHYHQARSVWSDVNIKLLLFQESIGKITSFLDLVLSKVLEEMDKQFFIVYDFFHFVVIRP